MEKFKEKGSFLHISLEQTEEKVCEISKRYHNNIYGNYNRLNINNDYYFLKIQTVITFASSIYKFMRFNVLEFGLITSYLVFGSFMIAIRIKV